MLGSKLIDHPLYLCCRFLAGPMEWSKRWTVCLLLLMTYRCYSSPLTSITDNAADAATEQRRKRSTAINDEALWSPDDDSQVGYSAEVYTYRRASVGATQAEASHYFSPGHEPPPHNDHSKLIFRALLCPKNVFQVLKLFVMGGQWVICQRDLNSRTKK